MDRANSFSSQRVEWHAAQSAAPRDPQVRETKGHTGARVGRVVVAVDPVRVVRLAERAQAEDGEASIEIRHSLAQLRRLLTMTTRAYEIDHRCCDDIPTCRERAPRCLIPAGGLAMISASGFTPHWAPMLGGPVSAPYQRLDLVGLHRYAARDRLAAAFCDDRRLGTSG